jgi:hypothetical protein
MGFMFDQSVGTNRTLLIVDERDSPIGKKAGQLVTESAKDKARLTELPRHREWG